MVSLLKLAEITEQGVKFESPHDGSEMMLTPEKSIQIQNSIGIRLINYPSLPHTSPSVVKSGFFLERFLRPKKKKKRNVSGNPTDPVKNSPTLIFFSCFPKIKTRKSKKDRVFQVPDRQMNKKI